MTASKRELSILIEAMEVLQILEDALEESAMQERAYDAYYNLGGLIQTLQLEMEIN